MKRIHLLLLTLLVLPPVVLGGDIEQQLAKRRFTEIAKQGDAAVDGLLTYIRTTDLSQTADQQEWLRLSSRKGGAVFALGHVGTPRALSELQKFLEQPEGSPEERAIYKQAALGALRVMVLQGHQRAEALALAQKALAQPDLVTTALGQLAQMGDRSSVALIRPIFERAGELWVKNSAASALARLGDASVVPHLTAEIERLRNFVPGAIYFDPSGYEGLSYLAGESASVRDRLRDELIRYAPAFDTAQGRYPVHRAAQGLLRADALTVELLVKILTLPADAGGVRYALDGLRHTHDAERMRRLLDQAVATPEVKAAWSKFGEPKAADLRAEAAKPLRGPEMGHIILAE